MKRCALYSRVSTKEQDPENQLIDLRRYAAQRGLEITQEFIDHGISGSTADRPQLNALMDAARKRKFDTILVWRFDRFARSTAHLLRSLEEFRGLGIDFISYQENIDTTSALGQAMFTIVSAIAQLERDIIRERVKCGLQRARAQGKKLGRRAKPIDMDKLRILAAQKLSVREIAKSMGEGKTKIHRALQEFR